MAKVTFENVWKKYGSVEAVKNLNVDCRDRDSDACLDLPAVESHPL